MPGCLCSLEKLIASYTGTPKIKRRSYTESAFRCFPSPFWLASNLLPRSLHPNYRHQAPATCKHHGIDAIRIPHSPLRYETLARHRLSTSNAPHVLQTSLHLYRMAKVIQQLSTALKESPTKRLIALLSYLHFATLQVPQHHTHHIGRIVQPQIRSLSAALQGGMLRSPSAKSAGQKSQSGSAQTATP